MKLNARWLAGLLIGTATFSGVTYLVHEYQIRRNASVYLREANRAKEENKLDEAANFLARYIALVPDDLEGQVMFGQTLFELERFPPAFLTLDKVIQRHPERSDIRRVLVKIAQKLRRFPEAIVHLQKHLLKESENDAELLAQLGACQVATKEYEKAKESFARSIDNDPKVLNTYIQLAVLLRERLNQPNEADVWMIQMVDKNSDNYLAYLNRAQWWMQCLNEMLDLAKASKIPTDKTPDELKQRFQADVAQTVKMAPDDASVIGLAAHVALDRGGIEGTEQARKILARGIDLFPGEPRFYVLLAEVESKAGNGAEAIEILRRGIKALPKERHFKWSLATLLIDLDQFEEVTQLIKQLRLDKQPEPLLSYLEGQMKLRQGDWSGAIKLLESARPRLNDSPVLLRQLDLWLGIAYRESASQEQQLASLHRSVADDPNWIPARLSLAESLLAANQVPEAADEYRFVMAIPGVPLSAKLGLVRCLLVENLRLPPEKQDWRELDEQLKQLDQLGVAAGAVAMFRMEELIAKQNIEEAEKVIEAAREKDPATSELWMAQISLAQMRKKWDEGDALIQSAIDRFGDIPSFRIIKVRGTAQRLGKEGLDQLRPLLVPASSWSLQQKLQFSANVAPLLLSIGASEEALEQATLVAKSEPNNVRIRLLQLDMALQSRNSELMKQVLSELQKLTSEGAIWQYGKALEHMLDAVASADSKDQRYKEALGNLETAKKMRPTWGKVPRLIGEIQEIRQDTSAAIEQYLEAIRLGEQSQNLVVRTLSLLLNSNRFNEADKLLRRMHESSGLFSDEMTRAEVRLSLQFGRMDDAKKAVEQLVKNSSQAQDPLWLGQVYATLKDLPAAEDQIRLAVKSHPEDARGWIALVQILVASKKVDEAEQVVNQAKAQIAEDQAMIAIGRCYELIGKSDAARSSYSEAVAKHPDDLVANQNWIDYLLKTGAIADAVSAARKLVDLTAGSDSANQDAQTWGRRKLALALMGLGQREGLVEALRLIDRNLEKSQSSIEDLRTQALILISLGEREQRDRAISVLESVLKLGSSSANVNDDRFLLARLYFANGELEKARSEVRKLFEIRNDEPKYLSLYIQLLIAEKDYGDADLYVSKLKKAAPNDLTTTDLETKVLFAREKYPEIVEALKAVWVRATTAQEKPEVIAAKKLWSAKRFEEFARELSALGNKTQTVKYNAEAEKLYSQIANDKAEEMLVLGEFLARGPQIDRALDLLQEHGAASQPFRIASLVFALMKNEKATPGQLARLQDLLQKNEVSHEHPILLTVVMADLLNWRGKAEEAVKVYREVLRRDAKNIAALNNLAVLIAFRGGDNAEATQLIQKAIAISGPKASLIDSRGLVHLAGGRPDKAIEDFRLAIRESENGERLFHSALALAQLNPPQWKAAKMALDKALQSGFSEMELHPLERAKYAKLVEQLASVEP